VNSQALFLRMFLIGDFYITKKVHMEAPKPNCAEYQLEGFWTLVPNELVMRRLDAHSTNELRLL
jgi:hypothetical protein